MMLSLHSVWRAFAGDGNTFALPSFDRMPINDAVQVRILSGPRGVRIDALTHELRPRCHV